MTSPAQLSDFIYTRMSCLKLAVAPFSPVEGIFPPTAILNSCCRIFQMGLCTGFGGGAALVNLIGYSKALDFLLSGRKLNPEEGMRLGYFDATVSSKNSLGECEEWMEKRLATTSPELIRTIKAVLRHGAQNPGTGT